MVLALALTVFRQLPTLVLSTQASALVVTLPLSPPSAAPVISPSHLSFSIEQDRWVDWVRTTSNTNNTFFFNTLDNLKQITGEPPQIRIGANSEDHTNFNPNIQFAQTIFPSPTMTIPYPEALNITVGDSYYQTARFLPSGTHVIWGVNLGQNNLTAAFLEARSLAKAFSTPQVKNAGIVLDFIEIGNEPDLYGNNGARSSSYNVTQYTREWIAFATNISAAASISLQSSTKFLAASFAGSSHSITGFSPQSIFNAGILDSPPGSFITTVSQHRYSGSFCTGSGGLLQDLMTKSTIRGNLSIFTPDIAATRQRGLDYILGETNSYSCHGAPGVSNTAGAALWTLDYALFATQVGISRVFFHEGIGFKYNLIQPTTLIRSTLDGSQLPTPLLPHVQPQYYAAIIISEAIGRSGSTRITELTIDHPHVAGYAFYESSKLARVVLMNSQAFLQGASNRSTLHLDFGFTGGSGPQTVHMKRLSIGHADDTAGLRWGGQTYETSSGRVGGSLAIETVSIHDGLDLQDTEAVLLSFV